MNLKKRKRDAGLEIVLDRIIWPDFDSFSKDTV
jgi:hypothetical protein